NRRGGKGRHLPSFIRHPDDGSSDHPPEELAAFSAAALVSAAWSVVQLSARLVASARSVSVRRATNSSSQLSVRPPLLASICHLAASTGSVLRPRPAANTRATRF